MNASRMRKTVGGIALSFVLAVLVGVSGVVAPGGGAALGATTTLTILGGEVQVSHDGGPFETAADGAVIGPGDVIRTAADARAVLTYFEGSTVSVDPSSELAIDEASSSPDGSTVVVMTQNLGRTWHVVTKLITGGSKYEVRTPAATASVRGTAFAVGVTQDAGGKSVTTVATTEGAVAAAAPATAADPQPEPVVVAAGFETTVASGDRKPQVPTLAPEPERTITVTIGNANSLVVDPLGRSNGFKDGKLVLQTPGAQVVRIAGTLLITLPNIPDGKLSTVVGRTAGSPGSANDVPIVTTVQERGKPSTLVTDTVRPTESVTGVEMKKGGAGPDATPDVRRVSDDEKKDLDTGKVVVELPKLDLARPRPGLGGDPLVIARIVAESRARLTGATGSTSDDGRPASKQQASESSATTPSGEGPSSRGFVQPLPFQGAPSVANQQREDARRADDSKRIEAEIRGSEQLRQAAESATKAAESARIVAERGQQQADLERLRAQEQARAAEEAARVAQRQLAEATDAARKLEAEAAGKRAAAEKAAAEAAKVKADITARAKADEAARAEAAKQAAAELAERARLEAERLRQLQKEHQQRGPGVNTNGSQSGGGAGGTKLPEIPLPGQGTGR